MQFKDDFSFFFISVTDRVGKLEHLLETRDVVVVDENSLNAPVEERGVVRLLAAQVEHLVPEQRGGIDIH